MADSKISALPAATTPLAGTEVLPIVQSGVTKQVSVANLTTGRAISATELTLSTGNLVIGTSGKGIDFSATPGTGTSELLADYEEGTWVPSQGAGLTVVGAFSSSGRYTKIGRLVSLSGVIIGSTSIATTAGTIMFGSAPFSAAEVSPVGAMNNDNRNVFGGLSIFGTTGYSVTTIPAGTRIDFSITYSV